MRFAEKAPEVGKPVRVRLTDANGWYEPWAGAVLETGKGTTHYYRWNMDGGQLVAAMDDDEWETV